MEYKATEEEELAAIDHELGQIEAKMVKLQDRKEFLVQRKTKLKETALLRKSQNLANRNWSQNTFAWSEKLEDVLKNSFKINEFRPLQLEAINATLSKEDVILIMPTGGGKSLCYQLPALVDKGITLVVSPLISLMEDQIMGLKKLNLPAVMLSASSSKDENKMVTTALQDPKAKIKLIYVTPEKLAKSKRFMSQLQKCAEQGRFSRLAIDEVHCCSVWGHDFRPDYKFLGVFKAMFPDTPIIGLTATSTAKVTSDVQKMLTIQGCLVLKATFNRPNLYYEVVPKPATQNECLDLLEDWLLHKFKNKSGIIYTTVIKDCEELTKELRKRNIKAGVYHAMLDAEVRSRMHTKWMSGEYQVVVATIAFGLGIDKPDVRFIIHHSLSKSMENFYQESGRAGRDGLPAQCIVMYRLADVFKLSTMVFTQQTGLENLYSIVNYCLDGNRCRRSMIAEHFDEVWSAEQCDKMCDHCSVPRSLRELDVTGYCRSFYILLQNAAGQDVKLTSQKLMDAWYNKGESKLRHKDVKCPSFSRTTGEAVFALLLIEGYLKEDFHFTPYSTISYVRRGPRSAILEDKNHRIIIKLPGAKTTPSNNEEIKERSEKSFSKRSENNSNNEKSEKSSNSKRKHENVKDINRGSSKVKVNKDSGISKHIEDVELSDSSDDVEVFQNKSVKRKCNDLFGSDDDNSDDMSHKK